LTAAGAPGPDRTDGRRERGLRRRRAILEATLSIIGEQGTAAVTHRAVAAAAGVPLAATTYYFASKDDLLDQALRYAAEEQLAALEGAPPPATGVRTVADAVERVWTVRRSYLARGRERALAHYEIYLEAARRPALRAVAHEWNEACVRQLAPGLASLGIAEPEAAARLVLAALDGFLISDLATHRPGFADDVLRPGVGRLLAALGGGQASPPAGTVGGEAADHQEEPS